MPAYVSANLLASYLAAAARQTSEGMELSSRSRWAIAHARRQLEGERDVLAGGMPATGRSVGASPTVDAPSLAMVVLRTAPATAREASEGHKQVETHAAKYLTQILGDLVAISDASDRSAAQRLAKALADPVPVAA